jgi:hypothetical protein
MNDIVGLSSALMRSFAEFTATLTPQQLEGLASGELRLAVRTGPGADASARALPGHQRGDEAMGSHETGTAYLHGLA